MSLFSARLFRVPSQQVSFGFRLPPARVASTAQPRQIAELVAQVELLVQEHIHHAEGRPRPGGLSEPRYDEGETARLLLLSLEGLVRLAPGTAVATPYRGGTVDGVYRADTLLTKFGPKLSEIIAEHRPPAPEVFDWLQPRGAFEGAPGLTALDGTPLAVGGLLDEEDDDGDEVGATFGQLGIVGFQGSKRRYAALIVDELEKAWGPATGWGTFYDACAGSGHVTLEVARRAPNLDFVMIDKGPWGRFWAAYAADRSGVRRGIERNVREGESLGTACRRFNGKPQPRKPTQWAAEFIPVLRGNLYTRLPKEGEVWKTTCVPAQASGRGPGKLLEKLDAMPKRLKVLVADAATAPYTKNAHVYVDPDYTGTAGYSGNVCNVPALVQSAYKRGVTAVAVSHDKPYPGLEGRLVTLATRCAFGRKKGGTKVCSPEVLIFPPRPRG
jgi:hypothetical protein